MITCRKVEVEAFQLSSCCPLHVPRGDIEDEGLRVRVRGNNAESMASGGMVEDDCNEHNNE